MATGLYNWSRTPANNATSTYNWAEGMAPSAVNDSARGDKADVAQWRDDIAGAIVTGGTSTAYTVTSYSAFTTLVLMSGQIIAFSPHATNGATVTLNVDGLGAKPLRSAPSVELTAGVLILGSPYVALYNNSDAAWYLQGFYVNPYSVPLGGMLDYIGSTAPNSAFVLPIGQAISRTTYATLFSLVSTTYGVGDGSTTFNVPDLTGRVTAMKEASATRLTSTYFAGNSTTLGAVGGAESLTLTAAQIPSITSANGSQAISVLSTAGNVVTGTVLGNAATAASATRFLSNDGGSGPLTSTGANNISVTSNNTGGTAHRTVQPTMIVNKILRVL